MARKTRIKGGITLMPFSPISEQPTDETTHHPGVSGTGGGAKLRKLHFEDAIARGENPMGFTAQTANGTAHAGNHPGRNQEHKFRPPPAEPYGTWKRGNRSGE